jgi:hypothetical protein
VASEHAPIGATIQEGSKEGMDPDTNGTPAPTAPAAKAPLDLAKLKVDKSCSRGLAGWLAANGES